MPKKITKTVQKHHIEKTTPEKRVNIFFITTSRSLIGCEYKNTITKKGRKNMSLSD